MNDPHFIKNLENIENQWGIRVKVTEEWDNTFDKLLEYYNTKDLRSICEEFCIRKGKRSDKFCSGNKFSSPNNLISLDELWKWMAPQGEPSIWKWIFSHITMEYIVDSNTNHEMQELYNKEKYNFLDAFKYLKENWENKGFNNTSSKQCKKIMVSKKDIIGFIIEELRNSDRNKGIQVYYCFQP